MTLKDGFIPNGAEERGEDAHHGGGSGSVKKPDADPWGRAQPHNRRTRMLIKMKESKGFTLVELMIVVAIIGILAAVAVPFYQRYVKKARLTSLVIPGIHAIENSISTYYSVQSTFPASDDWLTMTRDADTLCFNRSDEGDLSSFVIEIDASSGKCKALDGLSPKTLRITSTTSGGKVYWEFAGTLAKELGLAK